MSQHVKEPSGSFFLAPVAPPGVTWVAHCDGGAWPNPGAMAIGAVIASPAGEVHRLSQRLSGQGCNNEAEWRAAVAVLELALSRGATELLLHTDSTQVRDHLGGMHAPSLPAALQTWAQEARALATRLKCLTVRWVPRHRNVQADALAREALGLPPKVVCTPHPRARRRR